MKSPRPQAFVRVTSELDRRSLPDILARTGYGHGMAPVRVRGCVGESVLPGRPGVHSGKPMPGAGETAHVRRLFVDRSRCALEVSPAPRRVPMSLMTGRRAVVACKSGDTLSRRMWGRRPGRPDGWHLLARGFVRNGPPRGVPTCPRSRAARRAHPPESIPSPSSEPIPDRPPRARDEDAVDGYTDFQPSSVLHRTGTPAKGG